MPRLVITRRTNAAVCFRNDIVHVVPIVVFTFAGGVGTGRDSRVCGIFIRQRQRSVSVRLCQALELRDRNRLNRGEALRGSPVQILNGFFPPEPVKKLPRAIGQVEERLAGGGNQRAPVIAHSQALQGLTPCASSALLYSQKIQVRILVSNVLRYPLY